MKEGIEKLIKECELDTPSSDGISPKYTDRERYMMLRGFLLGLVADEINPLAKAQRDAHRPAINRDGGE